MSHRFILGVEGGGSTCRIVLGTADGKIMDKIYIHESASVATRPLSAAINTIQKAIDGALQKHKLKAAEVHIALCLPGASNKDRRDRLKAALDTYYQRDIPVESDAMAALLNIHGGIADRTGIVIAGTGSVMLAHDRGTIYRLGGKGYPRDPYSGAGIARECLAAYMDETRGSLRDTMNSRNSPLAFAFDEFIARHKLRLAADIDALPARSVAGLFPAILTHVTKTPQAMPTINTIFEKHLIQMSADIGRFCREAHIKQLALTGSVAQRLLPFIKKDLPPGVTVTQQQDAIDGAFIYAMETSKDPQFLRNLPVCVLDETQPKNTPTTSPRT